MLEGELIKKQVEEEIEKERQREMARKQAQFEQREQFKQANEDLKVFSETIRQKEALEEGKISEYARKKEAMEKLRRDKEEQKFTEKQKTR